MNVNPKERTESINIRVTPEEKAALKKLAAAAGMTLTGFLVGEALGEKLGDALLKGKGGEEKITPHAVGVCPASASHRGKYYPLCNTVSCVQHVHVHN